MADRMPSDLNNEIDYDPWEREDDEFSSESYDPNDPNGRWVTLRARAMVEGLRAFADHLEQNPCIAAALAPWTRASYSKTTFSNYVHPYRTKVDDDGMPVRDGNGHTVEEFDAEELDLYRRQAGLSQKFIDDDEAGFFKDFGPVRLRIQFNRAAICQMIPTGEVEDVEVEQVVTPAVTEKVIVGRPVVQRVCAKVWTA